MKLFRNFKKEKKKEEVVMSKDKCDFQETRIIKMNAGGFRKLSTKYLTPRLKEKGWEGTGFHFYKKPINHIIQIFAIQPSQWGGSACCETAIHFDFLKDLSGKPEPSKISYASCLIRQRLSPKGEGDYWWNYKNSEEENKESLYQIFESLENHGTKFYDDFLKFPYPFDKVTPNDFFNGQRTMILDKYYVNNDFDYLALLKEINLLINRPELAKEFSEIGIRRATEYYLKLSNAIRGKKQKDSIQIFLNALIKRLEI